MSACKYNIIRLTFKKKTFFSNFLTKVPRAHFEPFTTTMNIPFSPSNTTNDDLFVRAADNTDGTFMCAPFWLFECSPLVSLYLLLLRVKWNLNASRSLRRGESRDEYERDTDKTARAIHSRRRQISRNSWGRYINDDEVMMLERRREEYTSSFFLSFARTNFDRRKGFRRGSKIGRET